MVKLVKEPRSRMRDHVYSVYEAKTHLSRLIERAAKGEEIVISKNGVPVARLVALPRSDRPRRPANAMKITRIADDFDAPDPEIDRLFSAGPP